MSEKKVVSCFFNNSQDEITISIKQLIQRKSKTKKARKKISNVKIINPYNIPFLITQFGVELFSQSMTVDSIIELFYFCSKFAEKCQEEKNENYIPIIIESLINFLSVNLEMWIRTNNVWENIILSANNVSKKRKSNICSNLILLLL